MARLIVHLVHGTQFYLWRKPAIPWVEQEPAGVSAIGNEHLFRVGLRRRLEAKGHQVSFRVIRWSGRNRHSARRAAADRIRQSLEHPEEGAHHFLVAHSHGGNACVMALTGGDRQWEAGLSGVACLATPFLVVREAGWAVTANFQDPPNHSRRAE